VSYTLGERAGAAGAHVVEVAGVLDVNAAPDLKETLETAIERGTSSVVVDLDEVTFIDSTAIGVLLAARQRLGRSGRTLEIVCMERNVVRVLQIVGMESGGGPAGSPGTLAPPASHP
jgi:anti-sigma B factor antagonist